eukprot:TRINITY_DN5193_c0_g1_i1.p1 TRINITY_DN5193_c0_g1~~TRINITY_DN5193_c0_g1_i1.p1  ORF type:complete len:462 (-),score=64.88 TRINITY_DN5193_c0_g1_i1:119-1378(-)
MQSPRYAGVEGKQLPRTPSLSVNFPHTSWIRDLIELQDGSLVSCSDDHSIKRWSRGNGRLLASFVGHEDSVRCLLEVNSQRLMSGSLDKTIRVWNTTTGECVKTLSGCFSWGVCCLAKLQHASNRNLFACGLGDGTIEVRRITTVGDPSLEIVRTLRGHTVAITSLRELTNGMLVSSAGDHTVKLWNLNEPNKAISTNNKNTASIEASCIRTLSPEGCKQVSRVIQLMHYPALEGDSNKEEVIMIAAATDNAIRVWNATTGECVRTLTGHRASVNSIAEMRDGCLVSVGSDSTIRAWNNGRGECVSSVKVSHCVTCVVELQDGSIATTSGPFFGDEYTLEVRSTWNTKETTTAQGNGGANEGKMTEIDRELHEKESELHEKRVQFEQLKEELARRATELKELETLVKELRLRQATPSTQ